MCGANSSTLLCGIAIFVVFTDIIGMPQSLQPQGIFKAGFHRLYEKRHAKPFEVIRCGGKCTQSLACRSFIYDPRSSECKLFHDVKSARGHSGSAYIRTVPCLVEKNYVWRDHPQVCFKFETDTLRTWRDAEIDCQSDHGHLVKLDSSAKNELIVKFAQELRLEAGKLVGFNIGAKDGDEHGHWTWYDNTPVESPRWGPNEPSGDGYCAQILSVHSYRWNDVNCSDSWGYICEIPM